MFSLSWTVMHEIEEDGPLSDVDWTRPEEHIVGFIVTLMGHDGTYGQTVFARKTYDCGQIRQDEHFVDVVHQLEDGRLMVDYTRFHDTEPDERGSQDRVSAPPAGSFSHGRVGIERTHRRARAGGESRRCVLQRG